jgi:enamine deaminase RidA (YjgF/YER057c/UK114 family)
VATGAPLAQGAPERSYIEHVGPPGSKPLPFSDAVLTQDTLFVAGHLGIDPRTGNAAADAAAEARAVLGAVKRTVEAAGFAMDDLRACTTRSTPSIRRTFTDTIRRARSSVPISWFGEHTSRCWEWR